ncbi:MAG: DUF6290 family protein [Coriobacteriales bacterium]|jgi:hypothetical protein|nr:DUF6290 family protein [Coriobacteriales bacterium]
MPSTISVRLTDEERSTLEGYAATYNMSMSELLRSSALEAVQDAYDLAILKRARKQFKDEDYISHTDLMKEFGLV